ncbi:MAG: putative transporter [Bacteroidaceae bacterium]
MAILNLFSQSGLASTLLFLSLVAIMGMMLAKIQVFGIKLGIAGVLFSGLIVGHFGAVPDPTMLKFVKEFGLILFVYSIGLEVGPRFLTSLKNNGLTINLLASAIVLLGTITAASLKLIFDLDIDAVVGMLCGAVTNTPSLGAAQQIIEEQHTGSVETTSMAYAVAYPLGIVGIILVMILIRAFFKVKVDHEAQSYTEELAGVSGQLDSVSLKVQNGALVGKDFDHLFAVLEGKFALSRVFRNGNFFIPKNKDLLMANDILYGVSSQQYFSTLEILVGDLILSEAVEVTGSLGMQHVIFTNKKLAGKTIRQIGLSKKYPVNITRIYRNGFSILPTEHDSVEFGDTIRIVGERKRLEEAANYLGNSTEELSHPNIVPLFLGIFFGVLLGSVPIMFPGLPAPAKLGLAGGPLIVAIFLGHRGRIGKLNFFMTPGANLFVRELGIVLFLGAVGLGAGSKFISTIMNGGYMWVLYGAIITIVPLLIVTVIARFLKINYLTICGMVAGAMTDPPALEYANSLSNVQAQSTAYATVYPLSMFLRVLCAQILVLLLM